MRSSMVYLNWAPSFIAFPTACPAVLTAPASVSFPVLMTAARVLRVHVPVMIIPLQAHY